MSMDFIKSLMNKQITLPQPIEYLKAVIRDDTPQRANAFLAVSAGITLIVGFVAITIAMACFNKKLTTEFIAVNAALVSLATFNKVDAKPTRPPINNDDKHDDKPG